MRLSWVDHRRDPASWARALGVSREACELLLDADFIDLHLDLEVPVRVIGWDPSVHHGVARRPPPFWGHTDYPRLREAGFTGVVYDIATNPFRTRRGRVAVTLRNLESIRARVERHAEDLVWVTDLAGYREAKASGRLAFWVSLQGANALTASPDLLQGPLGASLHRVTLVHLTSSSLGGTSSPLGRDAGLTPAGRDMLERLNDARVLVDLAHAGKKTFWGALEAHSVDRPPIVSHTGVDAVRSHWRNLDDRQIAAIADRGGVVGVMYQSSFLAPGRRAPRSAVIDHLEHVIRVAGDDVPAIGTDYDGLIVPPHDLPDVTSHPLLVQDMLDRGWSDTRIRKILGGNYLATVGRIRP